MAFKMQFLQRMVRALNKWRTFTLCAGLFFYAQTAKSSALFFRVTPWQEYNSANFRILHHNPKAAQRIAQQAESFRKSIMLLFTNRKQLLPWIPKCDIYLYDHLNAFNFKKDGTVTYGTALSQPSQLYSGRILNRRINLALDDERVIKVTLRHELAHIILRDMAPKVPRWADEGFAVSAEPIPERIKRCRTLLDHLDKGPLYRVKTVMNSQSYPDGRFIDLYYAQSYSLAQFFIKLSGLKRWIIFLNQTVRTGYESALRKIYQIDGYSDLQHRWYAFAKQHCRRTIFLPLPTLSTPYHGPRFVSFAASRVCWQQTSARRK